LERRQNKLILKNNRANRFGEAEEEKSVKYLEKEINVSAQKQKVIMW
jgi:hypothetical protein